MLGLELLNRMVFRLFRPSANEGLIDRLHGEIVAAARDPVLFLEYGIEDSVGGRFETLALLAILVLRRLHRMPPPGPEVAQDLIDAIFGALERDLREAGIGDVQVPRRMKTLASAFAGRAAAYGRALDSEPPELSRTLLRNVYNGRGDPGRLLRYVKRAHDAIAAASLEDLLKGRAPLPPPSNIL